MTRGLVIAGIVGALATGCMFDRNAGNRPARFYAGPNMRAINVPVAGSTGDFATAGRITEGEGESEVAKERLSAVSASLQFTMATSFHTYAGGEVETGRLERDGSNFAGAYAILGGEHVAHIGSIGVELATGWRGIRYHLGDEDEDRLIFEPRVRGQFWIGEQWTLGGAVGARVGTEGEWMAGVYLGVHSQSF